MNIDDIIATRSIEVLTKEGSPERTMTVLIGRPTQEPTGEWRCPYQIIGDGSEHPFGALGLDAVQAIELALKIIGARLAATTEAREGRLRWAGERDLGFPLPRDPPATGEQGSGEARLDVDSKS
jgi:hypothetical protein